jgi:hypothetical protein
MKITEYYMLYSRYLENHIFYYDEDDYKKIISKKISDKYFFDVEYNKFELIYQSDNYYLFYFKEDDKWGYSLFVLNHNKKEIDKLFSSTLIKKEFADFLSKKININIDNYAEIFI